VKKVEYEPFKYLFQTNSEMLSSTEPKEIAQLGNLHPAKIK